MVSKFPLGIWTTIFSLDVVMILEPLSIALIRGDFDSEFGKRAVGFSEFYGNY